jgi:hypothetical protein
MLFVTPARAIATYDWRRSMATACSKFRMMGRVVFRQRATACAECGNELRHWGASSSGTPWQEPGCGSNSPWSGKKAATASLESHRQRRSQNHTCGYRGGPGYGSRRTGGTARDRRRHCGHRPRPQRERSPAYCGSRRSPTSSSPILKCRR